ncbi:hypothetical protein V1477_016999 [Vespula maculifrons]|uniref:Uncharacterized protein n=1 Tax=Vespula maculifrons TaxID=7453 RepID=A0ABD2B4Q8_VESMC
MSVHYYNSHEAYDTFSISATARDHLRPKLREVYSYDLVQNSNSSPLSCSVVPVIKSKDFTEIKRLREKERQRERVEYPPSYRLHSQGDFVIDKKEIFE